jgi:hypothetical protein
MWASSAVYIGCGYMSRDNVPRHCISQSCSRVSYVNSSLPCKWCAFSWRAFSPLQTKQTRTHSVLLLAAANLWFSSAGFCCFQLTPSHRATYQGCENMFQLTANNITRSYSCNSKEPGYLSRYSDWLRVGRPTDRSSSRSRVKNFLWGSGVHPTSYPMDTGGSFSGGKVTGAWSWPITSS